MSFDLSQLLLISIGYLIVLFGVAWAGLVCCSVCLACCVAWFG